MELDTLSIHYQEDAKITMNVPWDFTIAKVLAQHIFAEILKVHFDVINANVLEEKLWILSVESVKKLIVKLDLNQVLLDNV